MRLPETKRGRKRKKYRTLVKKRTNIKGVLRREGVHKGEKEGDSVLGTNSVFPGVGNKCV